MTISSLTRLHITPLTPDLLPVALGPNISGIAQNISYQINQTFPENNYGFLDLPPPDAKRLISKLNGAILKGRKMKVEEARPRKRVREDKDDDTEEVDPVQRNVKKDDPESDTLTGYELPKGRKVKRGWTERKIERSTRQRSEREESTKSQALSKYTNKEELLFRTNLPPNRKDLGNSKKGKDTKKKNESGHIVHEFEKTFSQPSFLRSTASTSNPGTHFVDGRGWLNAQDEIVEDEPPNSKRRGARKMKDLKIDVAKAQQPRQLRKKSDSESKPKSEPVAEQKGGALLSTSEDTSSSGVTTDEDLPLQSGEYDTEATGLGISKEDNEHDLPKIEIQTAPETPTKLHPLEALFKKPKRPQSQELAKPSLEVETAFSFFEPDAQEEDFLDDELPPMPITPFTSQDLNSRGIRSAAPTPDTAYPSRFGGYAAAFEARLGTMSNDKDDTNELEDQTSKDRQTSGEPKNETEFEKRFWAERAQNNRAWKSRRRTAMKDERQRENRARRTRNG